MPNKTLTYLSISGIVLLVLYVGLIGTAIFFATLRTELSASLRETETRVGALETEYYQALSRLNATDVESIGYVTPVNVAYIARDGVSAVTRASR